MDKYLRKYFDKAIDGAYVEIGVNQKDRNTFTLCISDGFTMLKVADIQKDDCDLFLMALDLLGWGYEYDEGAAHYLKFRQKLFDRKVYCSRR